MTMPPQKIDAMLAGLSRGETQSAIARQLGVTSSAISGLVSRMRKKKDPRIAAACEHRSQAARRPYASRPGREAIERRLKGDVPLPAPVSRDPCWRCGVRGDIGCEHTRCD